MQSVSDVLAQVQGLSERFLSVDEPTGKPALDNEPVSQGSANEALDDVENMMNIVQSSVISANLAIDSLLKRGKQDKLVKLFGEDAKNLLEQTKECLAGIADMFDLIDDKEEPAQEPAEEPKEPEPKETKPEEKPEEEPKV